MMLQIGHRESRDVDIFLPDPQYLGLLNPDKNDFKFEILPTDYDTDGTGFLKLAFENIGEIDFIVGHAMTTSPTIRQKVEGEDVLLETIPEIITKKIYYRGASIKPRDIFDIAAGGETHQAEIIEALRAYRQEATQALQTIGELNPDFIAASITSLAIKQEYRALAKTALQRTKEILLAL
jgi:hypothetical protein